MDMACGVKATDPVRGTVLMHRFREGRRESCGKRDFGVWGVWGERLAGYWKARCSFREAGVGGEGGERGGEGRRPSVASSKNKNINYYNDPKRLPQLQ